MQHQASFLKQHLLVWAPTCAQDIEKASGAKFYRGAAKVLRGFLEAECTLCSPEWGLDKVAPLEEVRRIYGAMPMWKGPTFDFSPDETSNAPMPSRQK